MNPEDPRLERDQRAQNLSRLDGIPRHPGVDHSLRVGTGASLHLLDPAILSCFNGAQMAKTELLRTRAIPKPKAAHNPG